MTATRGRSAVLAAVVAVTLLIGSCDGSRPSVTKTFTVPPGTAQKIEQGTPVPIMPPEIKLRVGDSIVIKNDDSVDQLVGPWFVKANKTFEAKFQTEGRFEFVCSFTGSGKLAIVVDP